MQCKTGRLPERGRKKWEDRREKKMSNPAPPSPTASEVGPCLTIIQISRTPRHWKFTQHLCTTRPPHAVSLYLVIIHTYMSKLNKLRKFPIYSYLKCACPFWMTYFIRLGWFSVIGTRNIIITISWSLYMSAPGMCVVWVVQCPYNVR